MAVPSTDTIAAVATAVAPGQGGIAVIRLSGPVAEATGRTVVHCPGRQEWGSHRVLYGHVIDGAGRRVDEVLLLLMRGNHLLAAAGTLVSNPLTYLPLYWFNYLVGCQLLGPGRGAINLAELNRSSLWAQGWEFSQRILLGSTVVGMVMAIASGWMAHQIFQREVEGYSSKGRNTNSNQTNNY